MSELSESDIEEHLEDLKIWGLEGDRLVTRIEFDGYRDACFFANTVFSLAEKEFHHPKVVVEYGSVEIDLWSHDSDGLTERDFKLARKIEDSVGDIDWK